LIFPDVSISQISAVKYQFIPLGAKITGLLLNSCIQASRARGAFDMDDDDDEEELDDDDEDRRTIDFRFKFILLSCVLTCVPTAQRRRSWTRTSMQRAEIYCPIDWILTLVTRMRWKKMMSILLIPFAPWRSRYAVDFVPLFCSDV
jgi:hypothetical protein